jgi:hypothetical protein
LLVRLELIKRVGVEWKVEKLFGLIAGVDPVVNKLVKQCRFPDAAPADEPEQGLIFKLTIGFSRVCEMVEIASLASGQVEGIRPMFPPRVVVTE